AYVRVAHEGGALVTAKHFPGHGATAIDSHHGVPVINSDLVRLRTNELVPFKKAIAAGVDSILLAHARVPAVDSDPNRVATFSPAVINELLRKPLGFDGLVVRDEIGMAGLSSMYDSRKGSPSAQAAVDAIKAGADIIMWPPDLDATFQAIVDAVRRRE